MRPLALWTSVTTILVLNIVIVLGLIGGDGMVSSSDAVLYGRLLMVLHVVLPISTVLMLTLLVKDGHWIGAGVFAAMVVGMIALVAMRFTGQKLSLGAHLVTDLCALNIYLIAVPWYRSNLTRSGQR